MDVPRPKRCQPGKRQPDLEEANIPVGVEIPAVQRLPGRKLITRTKSADF
jgi:hypothetical protein